MVLPSGPIRGVGVTVEPSGPGVGTSVGSGVGTLPMPTICPGANVPTLMMPGVGETPGRGVGVTRGHWGISQQVGS